jgi:hypothetical protein
VGAIFSGNPFNGLNHLLLCFVANGLKVYGMPQTAASIYLSLNFLVFLQLG